MRLHQASHSRNHIHSNLTLLWSALSQRAPFQLTNIKTDLLAFFVIVFFAAKPAFMSSKVPRILRTIIQDATVYFLVIFTSHFVFEMMLLLARVR